MHGSCPLVSSALHRLRTKRRLHQRRLRLQHRQLIPPLIPSRPPSHWACLHQHHFPPRMAPASRRPPNHHHSRRCRPYPSSSSSTSGCSPCPRRRPCRHVLLPEIPPAGGAEHAALLLLLPILPRPAHRLQCPLGCATCTRTPSYLSVVHTPPLYSGFFRRADRQVKNHRNGPGWDLGPPLGRRSCDLCDLTSRVVAEITDQPPRRGPSSKIQTFPPKIQTDVWD